MFSKTAQISILFSFFVSAFFFLAPTSFASSKTSLGQLVPIAEMRTPLVEEKELNSCLEGAISAIFGMLDQNKSTDTTGGGGGGGTTGNGVTGTRSTDSNGTTCTGTGCKEGESGGGTTVPKEKPSGTCSWDSIAWMAAKALMRVEFNGMVNMAQTGFFGNSSFVDNPDKYYSSVGGEVSDYFFANDYTNSSLLTPLKGQARSGVLRNVSLPFSESISTGTQFPGGEAGYKAYLTDSNNCSTGNSWDCYMAAGAPNNDAFSLGQRTQAAHDTAVSNAISNARNEVTAGGGFRDTKENCVYGHYIGCETITPGGTIKDQLNQYLSSSLDQLTAADTLDDTIASGVTNLYKTIIGWFNGGGVVGI